jgi:hypothetical protein
MQLNRDSIDYFHVELPAHDVVLAEGLPVESYLDCGNRHAFVNGGGATMLFADFRGDNWEMSGYAPLVLRGPEVEAVRARLLARAAGLACETEALAGQSLQGAGGASLRCAK